MRLSQKPQSVAVIGTGALGSELAYSLAQHGVRNVLLVDPQQIQPRNLACSAFLSQAALHGNASSFKVDLLKAEAARAFGLSWQSATVEIADVGLGILAEFDILCSCTDSALSRAETALAARLLQKPMLDCGVFGDFISGGRVSFFAPWNNAGCYLCGMGEHSRAQLLAYASSASLGCAPAPRDVPMTGTASTVQHTARTAVALLQALISDGFPAHSTAWRLSRESSVTEWSTQSVALPPSSTCPWHTPLPDTLVELPWQAPLADSLRQHANNGTTEGLLQLHWPLCILAVCRECGSTVQPLQRVARVRRTVHCDRCLRAGTLEPLSCVSTISADDTLAGLTPEELHLPPQQLHFLRQAFAWPVLERALG